MAEIQKNVIKKSDLRTFEPMDETEKGIPYSDVEDQKQKNILGSDKSGDTIWALFLAAEFIWMLIALIIIY